MKSNERIRVLLALPSLQGGGAERVAVNIAKHVDRNRFDLKLGLLQKTGPYLAEVDDDIVISSPIMPERLTVEGDNRAIYRPDKIAVTAALAPANLVAMLKEFRPHVVMSFLKGMSLNAQVATKIYGRDKLRWIAREGNNTIAVIEDELASPFARKAVTTLVKRCYNSADRVVTIAHEMAASLEHDLSIPRSSFRTVHNAIEVERVQRLGAEESSFNIDRDYIVAVGRLDRQKGFDTLLKSFAKVAEKRDVDCVILGEGPERESLEALAASLGVAERVHLPGFVDNPWAVMSRAELFALTSRWEGFGNVVAESLAVGLPTIVSDCNFGPKEIVGGDAGIVVPVDNVDAFADAFDRVLGNDEYARTLSKNGQARAQDFLAKNIVAQYENVFSELYEDLVG